MPAIDSDLQLALQTEKQLFSAVSVPIATVSATYRKELLKNYHVFSRLTSEVIYSRAHFSMAEAVRQQALHQRLSTHVIDPLNFVATNNWQKLDFTQLVGQLMARHKTLRWLKGKIDTKARNKLPISNAITPVLQHIASTTTKPIISLHYEAGNFLASRGHKILQVVTDPHVRPQYLDQLPYINPSLDQTNHSQITFAVFDNDTKTDFLGLAKSMNKYIRTKNIIITGAPVDLRITKLAKNKSIITKNAPINIGVTTGGLGTNLQEIKTCLDSLSPLVTTYPERIRLFLYAGTHRDFRNYYEQFAKTHNLRIGNLDDQSARVRILYEDSIIDANENLIKYLFPWAHGIISKPSGDMAYEAVAAGCFLLMLEPWGEWEENIKKRILKKSLGFDFNAKKAHKQFLYLLNHGHLKKAQNNAKNLPHQFRSGTKKIIQLHQKLISSI